jgi:UDP-N-acetylmuramate dehydrogenase
MKEIVDATVSVGLKGLEWAGGLPGSFGGAIYGNAGCYGGEIKDSIVQVKSITEDGKEKLRSNLDCEFGYRDSIFKHVKEVIISATVALETGDRAELRTIADDHVAHRQGRHPLEYPNAGSIFKNVPVGDVPSERMALFEDSVKNDPFPIVPAAKIIAVAKLQGRRIGDIQLSDKHSNFMVNLGDGKTDDLLKLIEEVKTEVNDQYQIKLEVEPQLVGF